MWLQATLGCPSQLLCGAGEHWDLSFISTVVCLSLSSLQEAVLSLPQVPAPFSAHLPALCDSPLIGSLCLVYCFSQWNEFWSCEGLCFLNSQLPAPFPNRSELLEDSLYDFLGLESPEPATDPGPKTRLTNVHSAPWIHQKAPSSRDIVLVKFTFLPLPLWSQVSCGCFCNG